MNTVKQTQVRPQQITVREYEENTGASYHCIDDMGVARSYINARMQGSTVEVLVDTPTEYSVNGYWTNWDGTRYEISAHAYIEQWTEWA